MADLADPHAPIHSTSLPPTSIPPTSTVTTLDIEPWPDQVIDQLGHDPRSLYVERFWLGILGPSTILLPTSLAVIWTVEAWATGVAATLPSSAPSTGSAGSARPSGVAPGPWPCDGTWPR